MNIFHLPDNEKEKPSALCGSAFSALYGENQKKDAYINSLVMYNEVGPDSQIHSYTDADMKIQVQMKIVDVLQNKWRKLI
ncbi:hypothetical protein B5G27_01290 [Lachnoclostridium sp. An76]|nr:hypothetical protein B5G27_01290 [Lachnoclostridium sp. An76]